jgi:Pentapeptide repeats (8 copies)
MQGASLTKAISPGADFTEAQLQGAVLDSAALQAASFFEAQLQGADFSKARLTAAQFSYAKLEGADLTGTDMRGASFSGARMQGAYLSGSHMHGASFGGAQLQGAEFSMTRLTHAEFAHTYLWRVTGANCADAYVVDGTTDPIIEALPSPLQTDRKVVATTETLSEFIERVVATVPNGSKAEIRKRLTSALTLGDDRDAAYWRNCAEASRKITPDQYYEQRATLLSDLACSESEGGDSRIIARGIVRNWVPELGEPTPLSVRLARSLLDRKNCVGVDQLDRKTKEILAKHATARSAADRQ